LNFSDAPPPEINIFYALCLAVNEKPTLLDYVLGVYLVKIILLRIDQAKAAGWTTLQILRRHTLFDH
jgi:hypothetical protein